MNMRKNNLLVLIVVIICSVPIFAQSTFVVKYSFDANVSAALTQGVGVTGTNAISGGTKLSNAGLINDGGQNVWNAQIVNNNATNFTNSFIRVDIYPPAGSVIVINDIVAKQRSSDVLNGNVYRIGCTLNGAIPVTTNTEQSTGNTPLTSTYTSGSFTPGNTVNTAQGTDFISVFLCARGSSTTTFNWFIDEIEIKGTVLNNPSPLVTINNTKLQHIDVMGGDMERSSDFIQKAANTQEVLNWFVKDIDYNYFRVRYDKKQELTEGVKNWDFYNDQVKTMKTIRQLNPTIKFLATMRSDYNGFGEDNQNNLPVFIYNYACTAEDANGDCISSTGDLSFNSVKYGIFLADYIEFMYNQGVPIDYLATAKEWQNVVTVQRSCDAYVKMKSELTNRGIPVPKLIGPASWGINSGISFVNSVNTANYKDDYFAYSTHNLGDTPELWGDFVNASKAGGKMCFDDESATAAGGRTSGVEPSDLNEILQNYKEKSYMYNAGLNGEIFFEVWSRGVNSETRSVYIKSGQNGIRMRSYYIMKDFVNSSVNKDYCKSVANFAPNVTSLAFRDDSYLSVWLINESDSDYNNLSLQIPGTTMYGDVIQHFWKDPSKKEATENIISNPISGNSSLSVTIGSKSINYFKIAINPSALSVKKNEFLDLKLFPNPVKDYVSIDGTEAYDSPFEIFNISGLKLKSGFLKTGQKIETSNFATGIYFIRLGNQTYKFVKE
jgi:hypothetical protein